MIQLKLIEPEELGWVIKFTKTLTVNAEKKRWRAALDSLCMLGVALPGDCGCDDPRESYHGATETWLHQSHAEFNRRVRAAIMAIPGARDGLRKALYRDVKGPTLDPDRPEYGQVFLRTYGELVLDFLRKTPRKDWFRDPPPPVPAGQLYQGSALQDQHLEH